MKKILFTFLLITISKPLFAEEYETEILTSTKIPDKDLIKESTYSHM